MQLGAYQTALGVYRFDDALVKGEPLFGVQRRAEAVVADRHIAQNDHRAAALGNRAIARDQFILGQPH